MATFNVGYLSTPSKGGDWDALNASRSSSSSLSSPEGRNNELCNTSPETECSLVSSSQSSGESDSGSPPASDAKQGAPRSPEKQKDLGSDHEYDKPPYSYIALISMSLLKATGNKLLLGDIYQYCMDNFPYYKYCPDKAWRNSIRHNLSLNECFIKAGRADNGKGNYWAIHPACQSDFAKGDYRRRQARRRARKNQVNVSQLPMSYRYNMGYVPMTTMPTGMGHSMSPYPRATQYHHYSYSPSAYSPIAYQPTYHHTPSPSPTYTATSPTLMSPPSATPSPYSQTTPLSHHQAPQTSLASSPYASGYLNMPAMSHSPDFILQGTQLTGITLKDMPALRDALSGLL